MSHTVRIIGALSIAASAYMGLAAAREWQVRHIYGADEFLGSKILSEQRLDPRLSYKTTREALTRCITTRSSTWFTLISQPDRTAIDDNCQTFAAATQSIGAKHSEAHLTAAFRAVGLGDYVLASAELARSQEYAPVDRFNVEWRLTLGHRLAAYGSDRLAGPYNCARDFDLLATHLPTSHTLTWLREAQSPLLTACGA